MSDELAAAEPTVAGSEPSVSAEWQVLEGLDPDTLGQPWLRAAAPWRRGLHIPLIDAAERPVTTYHIHPNRRR